MSALWHEHFWPMWWLVLIGVFVIGGTLAHIFGGKSE